MNFEIGQIVTWETSGKIRKGIFKREINKYLSEVKVIEYNGRRFVIDTVVETNILRKTAD